MRFFKAFTLLHRRTKSEPVPTAAAAPQPWPPAFEVVATPPACFYPTDTPYATPPRGQAMQCLCFNQPNTDSFWKEKQVLETQLKECQIALANQTDVVASLRKTIEEKDNTTTTLRNALSSYQRDIAAGGVSKSPKVPSYSTIPISLDTTTNIRSPLLLPSVIDPARNSANPRTLDNYYSALQITLDTRKELRDAKKAAKFWKRKAADQCSANPQELLTPSPSDISSIHSPLPPDRQSAVHALIQRRRELKCRKPLGDLISP